MGFDEANNGKTTLRVDLLGTSFSITVESEPEYMQAIYGRYRTMLENTRKATGVEDSLKLAILTGLELVDEMEKLRSRSRNEEGALESIQVERHVQDMINRIDEILPN
jgi:cell division protein ZapA (FtsZ GTPase activity inhibitor)